MRELNDDTDFDAIPAEGIGLEQTDLDHAQRLQELRQQVAEGLSAPLAYHMYSRHMDVSELAVQTGLFKWQVKRHLKPRVFARMSPTTKAVYCEALDLSVKELDELPPG